MDLHALHRDESGIVTGWIIRLVVGLALVAVVLFDGGAIVVNYFSVDSAADEVALEVVARIGSGEEVVPNRECTRRAVDPTCRAVYDVAREKGVRIVRARFDQDGVFHVTAKATADTLIVGRIGAIEDWATATASARADTN
ncbi:MAG: hypothetical protein M3134_08855 [Actinomycetota bacterium]|nr:hypothetical protein [Actinomycetota bacterium]